MRTGYTGSMRTRWIVEICLLLVLCAAGVALLRHGPQEPARPAVTVPPDYVPLSIQGVRPGMTREQVEALLGAGRQLRVRNGFETTVYGDDTDSDSPELQHRWVTVTWKADGTAGGVRGSHLHDLGGQELLGRGWPEGEASHRLGPPDVRSGKPSPGEQGRWGRYHYWNVRGLTVRVTDGRLANFELEP